MNSLRNGILVRDVSGEELNVVVALHDVKHGDYIAPGDERLDDMAPQEAAPANNKIDVF